MLVYFIEYPVIGFILFMKISNEMYVLIDVTFIKSKY